MKKTTAQLREDDVVFVPVSHVAWFRLTYVPPGMRQLTDYRRNVIAEGVKVEGESAGSRYEIRFWGGNKYEVRENTTLARLAGGGR